jgi:CheY-like chemotaxis protein
MTGLPVARRPPIFATSETTMSKRRQNANAAVSAERFSIYSEAEKHALAHKWIESEKMRRDLGNAAIIDWHRQYWWIFCRERFIEHLLGEKFWTELGERSFGLVGLRFAKDDELIQKIVEIFRRGGENLDAVQYAISNNLNLDEVLLRLELFDINAARLTPNVAITEKQFIDNIRARRCRNALAIDADVATRRKLREILTSRKFQFYEAENAKDGLAQASNRRFDVFFIELDLAERLGTEVADMLARHGVKAMVVAISGNLADWHEDDLRDCGFTDILSKPFDRAQIEKLLDNLPVSDTWEG